MEFSFSQLKQKEVINLNDGKNMGKVCDVSVTFPENAFIGITVTGGKGFRLTRGDMFLPVSNIVKIGEDTILVKCGGKEPPPPPCPPPKGNCPPPRGNCPPPKGNCPPPRGNYPPPKGNYPPPRPNPQDRRSYDEYE